MKIAVFGDTHCGHRLGLTPPDWQHTRHKLGPVTAKFWEWFDSTVPEKVDVAIWNGDLVDGEGRKDSNHHLTTDINDQVEIAIQVIERVNAKKNIFVYGTPYHTGNIADYEYAVAKHFNCDIRSRQKIDVAGVKFDIMHTVGKSGTPVGGDIQLTKTQLWSAIYDQIDGRDHADIILRSHAHEFRITGNSVMKGFIIPALKLGMPDYDRYARRLDGRYDVGFLEFNFKKGDEPINIYPKLHTFKYIISGGYRKV